MTGLKIADCQIWGLVTRASVGRLTFGDADRPQDAVDEEDAIEALPVNINLSKEILGVGRAPLRFEDLVEVVEVLHLGCRLPTSSRWIDKLDEPRGTKGGAAARCDAMRCTSLGAPSRDGSDSLSGPVNEFAEPDVLLANTQRWISATRVAPRPILARFPNGLFCLPMPVFSEGAWSNSRLDCTLCNGNPLLRLIDCILCLEPKVLLC